MKNNERTETVTTADTAVVTKPNYKSIKNKVLATTFALAVNACLISSVSAAGGAFLEWMEGKVLPGVKVLG